MRIEIDKEEYKDLIETKEEFLKTVRKLDNITIETIKLTDKLQEKEQECEELIGQRDKLEFGNNILEHERNKYKQALDEIEKQVKAINNECFYDASCDCNNCDMKNNCPYYRKFKTLDIINKAKDGEQ